ncbi:9799_t:CDS:2, partial [Scutellospora calospora]
TVKQNLSYQIKYNKGFEYAKKIKEKEKIHNNISEFNKKNLLGISNPYLMQTKGAPKKYIKSTLENKTSKYYNKKTDISKDKEDKLDSDKQLEKAIRVSRQN